MSLSNIVGNVWQIILELRFIWIPAAFIAAFWQLWIYYVQALHIKGLKWVLLEIKMPREITKGPKAVELLLNSLYVTKDGSFKDKYWKGFLRPWFSLEIASINGKIRFFIYAQESFRNLIEAQIYSQFPNVEISQADDYTKIFFLEEQYEKEWNIWGTEFAFTTDDGYPIKTYTDYGLTGSTKDEQQIDPLSSFLEFMAAMKDGEQIWFQVLARATKKDWKEEGKKAVEKVKPKPAKEGEPVPDPVPGAKQIIEATERNMAKFAFDAGIRAVYLAKADRFDPVNIASLIGVMKNYNSPNLNGFKPSNSTASDSLIFKSQKESVKKRAMIDAYRLRSYFYIPYERKPIVMSTEELATLYHFPGKSVETSAVGRIEAKRGEPPVDLPV